MTCHLRRGTGRRGRHPSKGCFPFGGGGLPSPAAFGICAALCAGIIATDGEEAISFSQASLLNVSEISRECEVSRKTVEGYLSVLEAMLLGNRLPVFSRKAKRALIKHAKFYFSDCGVFRSVRPKGPLDRVEEMDGAALEGLVYQHLKAWTDYSKASNELYFWRTQAGSEVDFVLYGESEFCALEVKNSRKVHRKDLTALKTFQTDYPESSVALLYRGTERRMVDGVLCLPCEDFLRRLTPDQAVIHSD